jgi:hypothetical protein
MTCRAVLRLVPMLLAVVVAGCAAEPGAKAPAAPQTSYRAQTDARLTGAIAVDTLRYAQSAGVPPDSAIADVPAYVTSALKAELQRAGVRVGAPKCRLEGVIRNFTTARASAAYRHVYLDIRYVLWIGAVVQFDQAIGSTWTGAVTRGDSTAANAAIAKNLDVLMHDAWFGTLLSRECRAAA